MLRYIAKRVLSAIITIWFIMTLTFILMNAIPGDPFASEKMNDPVIIANMKAKYGLDKPFIEQYGTCLLYTSPSPRDLSTSRMPSSA